MCFVPGNCVHIYFFIAKQSNGLKEERSIHLKVSTCKQIIKCPYTRKPCVPKVSQRSKGSSRFPSSGMHASFA